MDPVLARYASRPAPRYTSYPTAPHFSAEVGEGDVRHWLTESSGGGRSPSTSTSPSAAACAGIAAAT